MKGGSNFSPKRSPKKSPKRSPKRLSKKSSKTIQYKQIECSKFRSQDTCVKNVLETAQNIEKNLNFEITNIVLRSVQTWSLKNMSDGAKALSLIGAAGAASYASGNIINNNNPQAKQFLLNELAPKEAINYLSTGNKFVMVTAALGTAFTTYYTMSGYSTKGTIFYKTRDSSEILRPLQAKTVHSSFFSDYLEYINNVVSETNVLIANGNKIVCVISDTYKTGVIGRTIWYSVIFYRNEKSHKNIMNGDNNKSPSPRRRSTKSSKQRRLTIEKPKPNKINTPSKLNSGSPKTKIINSKHVICDMSQTEKQCTNSFLKEVRKIENKENKVVTSIIITSIQNPLVSKSITAVTGVASFFFDFINPFQNSVGNYVLNGYKSACTLFYRKRKSGEIINPLKSKKIYSDLVNFSYDSYIKNVINESNNLLNKGNKIISICSDVYRTAKTSLAVWYTIIFYR